MHASTSAAQQMTDYINCFSVHNIVKSLQVSVKASTQGLVKGAELCLNPYFFGWLEK